MLDGETPEAEAALAVPAGAEISEPLVETAAVKLGEHLLLQVALESKVPVAKLRSNQRLLAAIGERAAAIVRSATDGIEGLLHLAHANTGVNGVKE